MIPVEIRVPWRYWTRAQVVLRDAGLATELESGTLDALSVIAALERHDRGLLQEIRLEHDRLWCVARMAGIHSGARDHLLLLMTHDVLADWAAGGLAAIFAQPFIFAARPQRRRRLIQSYRPRLVVHDEFAVEQLRAVEPFAQTRLLLASEAST